jgi:hypothetical protein
MNGHRRTIGFVLVALTLTLSLAACFGREDQVTVDNRTTKDVVIVTGGDYSASYLVPGCGRIVLKESDGAKPLDPSAPLPAGAVVIHHDLPGHPETSTIEAVTITSDQIWSEGDNASLPPCAGVPPTPPG